MVTSSAEPDVNYCYPYDDCNALSGQLHEALSRGNRCLAWRKYRYYVLSFASGSLVCETALKISTIVKFSQNVLLGIAAFVINIYWTYINNPQLGRGTEKPTLAVIWERFPKFVLGFVGASLIFSFVPSAKETSVVKDSMKSIQTPWFVLAFTSIGLETKFSDLINQRNRKPMYAFLIVQDFNTVVTLVVASYCFVNLFCCYAGSCVLAWTQNNQASA
ncbi:MAG: YeiH family protein [Sporocytophaga sp.]|nr:YeiH family protein [Sporocytophaga sp.]